jgi:hypothetical protein
MGVDPSIYNEQPVRDNRQQEGVPAVRALQPVADR